MTADISGHYRYAAALIVEFHDFECVPAKRRVEPPCRYEESYERQGTEDRQDFRFHASCFVFHRGSGLVPFANVSPHVLPDFGERAFEKALRSRRGRAAEIRIRGEGRQDEQAVRERSHCEKDRCREHRLLLQPPLRPRFFKVFEHALRGQGYWVPNAHFIRRVSYRSKGIRRRSWIPGVRHQLRRTRRGTSLRPRPSPR